MQAEQAATAAQVERARSVAEGARGADTPERVVEAARQFEALLATMLVKEMRASLEEGFFGKGPGADTFSSMLDEKLGNELAEQELFGLKEMLEKVARERIERSGGAQ